MDTLDTVVEISEGALEGEAKAAEKVEGHQDDAAGVTPEERLLEPQEWEKEVKEADEQQEKKSEAEQLSVSEDTSQKVHPVPALEGVASEENLPSSDSEPSNSSASPSLTQTSDSVPIPIYEAPLTPTSTPTAVATGSSRPQPTPLPRTGKLTPGEMLDLLQAVQGAGKTFVRTFAAASAARTLLNVLTSLISGRIRHKRVKDLVDFKLGLFLGGFSASFKALYQILKIVRRKEDTLAALVSGGVAGLSILALPKEDRPTWAVYTLVRSGHFLARALAVRHLLFRKLAEYPWDTILMSLSAGQILYGFIYEQSTVSPSYLSFLKVHGGTHPVIIKFFENSHKGQPIDVPALQKLYPHLPVEEIIKKSKEWVEMGLEKPYQWVCRLGHPGKGCGNHLMDFFIAGIKRALPVYAPIHGFYALVVLYHHLVRFRKDRRTSRQTTSSDASTQVAPKQRPTYRSLSIQIVEVFVKFLQNLIRSSVFLSLYCTLGWSSVCFVNQNINLKNGPYIPSRIGLSLGGLGTLIEAKGRRMELALYCLPRALESAWKDLVLHGWVKNIPNAEVALFCVATSIITAVFKRQPDAIRPTILSTFKWLWD